MRVQMRQHLYALVVSLLCGLQVTMAGVSASGSLIQDDTSMSRAQTETIVKQDLAQRLKVRADQLKLISSSDRTWMDANFGCGARKGLVEPTPIPGFAFTFDYGGKQYVYHTDRIGHFRRCPADKPIAPISR